MTGTKEKAKADTAEDAKAGEDEFIAFKGHNGVRIISEEDWAAIGVEGQAEARWDRSNGWRLPRSEFGARALNYLLKVDGEFVAEKLED